MTWPLSGLADMAVTVITTKLLVVLTTDSFEHQTGLHFSVLKEFEQAFHTPDLSSLS